MFRPPQSSVIREEPHEERFEFEDEDENEHEQF
jgi:hypothetical protein